MRQRGGFLLLLVVGAGCERGPRAIEPLGHTGQASAPVADRAPRLPDRPLRLGRPPHLSARTKAEYYPLVNYLAEAITHRIELFVPANYDAVVDEIVTGEIDLALLTPFAYVTAKERLPELRLLASILAEGSLTYRSYIVTKSGAPYRRIADIAGKRFAFVDLRSASGYLFPRALLLDEGLDSERDFALVQYLGSHIEVARAVAAGSVDAGAVSSTTFVHMRNEAMAQRLHILAKSDPIPLDAFVTHPRIPSAVAEKLQQTLLGLSMRTPAGRAVLRGVTITNGFVPGDDRAYDTVRRVARRFAR